MEEEEVLTLRPLFEETLVEPTNQLELDFGPGRHVQFFLSLSSWKVRMDVTLMTGLLSERFDC